LLAGAALALVLVFFPFGLMRNHYIRIAANRYANDGSAIVAVKEGLTDTIVYLRRDFFEESVRFRLLTNATSMSAWGMPNVRYMSLFVYLPVALHPDAKEALLISYGVGATAKALTDTRSLERIDVVDISRDILDLSRLVFPPPQQHPLDDPRVRIRIEDGRFHLLTTDRRYDLITGEPPPPKHAGVVNLYTAEYFQLVHDRLREGGIATYWLPAYQFEWPEALSVVKGFCTAFSDCSLWTGFGPELILMGSRGERRKVTVGEFRRQWEDPIVSASLRSFGFEDPEQLGTYFLADAATLRDWTRDHRPLEDNFPHRLSHRFARYIWPELVRAGDPQLAAERFSRSPWIREWWPNSMREAALTRFDELRMLHRYLWSSYGARPAGYPQLHEVLTRTSMRTPVLWLLNTTAREEEIARRAKERGVSDPLLDGILGLAAFADRDYLRAESYLQASQRVAPYPEQLLQLRVLALCLAGETERAGELLVESRPSIPLTDETGWTWLTATFELPPLSESAGGSR
jgi:hypothetical protein